VVIATLVISLPPKLDCGPEDWSCQPLAEVLSHRCQSSPRTRDLAVEPWVPVDAGLAKLVRGWGTFAVDPYGQ
jgi:hypothetical protein